ncbi:hypothetical protein HPHPP13_1655 [Helicobacter pylori Hp P-13]|nr:hypothetical protein HPHPP13_1655 [Helicobacter pylori Hp P-13]
MLWLLEWLKTTAKKSLFANRKGVKTCKPNDPKSAKNNKNDQKTPSHAFLSLWSKHSFCSSIKRFFLSSSVILLGFSIGRERGREDFKIGALNWGAYPSLLTK